MHHTQVINRVAKECLSDSLRISLLSEILTYTIQSAAAAPAAASVVSVSPSAPPALVWTDLVIGVIQNLMNLRLKLAKVTHYVTHMHTMLLFCMWCSPVHMCVCPCPVVCAHRKCTSRSHIRPEKFTYIDRSTYIVASLEGVIPYIFQCTSLYVKRRHTHGRSRMWTRNPTRKCVCIDITTHAHTHSYTRTFTLAHSHTQERQVCHDLVACFQTVLLPLNPSQARGGVKVNVAKSLKFSTLVFTFLSRYKLLAKDYKHELTDIVNSMQTFMKKAASTALKRL